MWVNDAPHTFEEWLGYVKMVSALHVWNMFFLNYNCVQIMPSGFFSYAKLAVHCVRMWSLDFFFKAARFPRTIFGSSESGMLRRV